jgi:hypothetical protein
MSRKSVGPFFEILRRDRPIKPYREQLECLYSLKNRRRVVSHVNIKIKPLIIFVLGVQKTVDVGPWQLNRVVIIKT